MAIAEPYKTPSGLTDEIRGQLATIGTAVLATIQPDGSPHLTELLFLLDEQDRILLPTPDNTRKFKNVSERPVATVFFNEIPGWVSATGSVEIWTGEKAAVANQKNRDRLLTEAGHRTAGKVLAEHENTTIVVTPTKWLSWKADRFVTAVKESGADLEKDPPSSWFKDLKG